MKPEEIVEGEVYVYQKSETEARVVRVLELSQPGFRALIESLDHDDDQPYFKHYAMQPANFMSKLVKRENADEFTIAEQIEDHYEEKDQFQQVQGQTEPQGSDPGGTIIGEIKTEDEPPRFDIQSYNDVYKRKETKEEDSCGEAPGS